MQSYLFLSTACDPLCLPGIITECRIMIKHWALKTVNQTTANPSKSSTSKSVSETVLPGFVLCKTSTIHGRYDRQYNQVEIGK